jgi:hypothetical protein
MLTILLGSIVAITVSMPDEAEAVSTPVVEIKWAEGQEVQEADVRPGESGLVTFAGTVSAELAAGGAIQDVRVELVGSTDQGWPVTVTPAIVMLNPGTEEKAVSVTVAVTPETSYYTSGTLTLGGRAAAFPGSLSYNIPSISGTIKIKQYYRFSIGCSKPYIEVAPSERLVFNLQIVNEGNARDKFGIEIKNLEKLSKSAWTVTLSRPQIEIPEKNEETIPIPVGTPIKFNLWINEVQNIEVIVRSVQEELNEGFTLPQTFTLTVRQRGFSTPGFEPFFIIFGLAGLAVFIKTRNVSRLSTRKRRRLRK